MRAGDLEHICLTYSPPPLGARDNSACECRRPAPRQLGSRATNTLVLPGKRPGPRRASLSQARARTAGEPRHLTCSSTLVRPGKRPG